MCACRLKGDQSVALASSTGYFGVEPPDGYLGVMAVATVVVEGAYVLR